MFCVPLRPLDTFAKIRSAYGNTGPSSLGSPFICKPAFFVRYHWKSFVFYRQVLFVEWDKAGLPTTPDVKKEKAAHRYKDQCGISLLAV